jgi:hypothetical protein
VKHEKDRTEEPSIIEQWEGVKSDFLKSPWIYFIEERRKPLAIKAYCVLADAAQDMKRDLNDSICVGLRRLAEMAGEEDHRVMAPAMAFLEAFRLIKKTKQGKPGFARKANCYQFIFPLEDPPSLIKAADLPIYDPKPSQNVPQGAQNRPRRATDARLGTRTGRKFP